MIEGEKGLKPSPPSSGGPETTGGGEALKKKKKILVDSTMGYEAKKKGNLGDHQRINGHNQGKNIWGILYESRGKGP